VRSSATAEDLPDASFAGQQETYLNIHGWTMCCWRSGTSSPRCTRSCHLIPRAPGFAHSNVALSAGVQRMVRSDKGPRAYCSPRHRIRIRQVVFITSAYGLGETVYRAGQSGRVYVYKTAWPRPPAILRRNLGSKRCAWCYRSRAAGRSVQTLDVPEKATPFLHHDARSRSSLVTR